MPLVSIANDMRRARAEHFAVPFFGAFDTYSTDGILAAAAEQRAPVIVGVYGGTMMQPNGRALTSYIRVRAEESPVPVSLLLDHGRSVEECFTAISYGFTDVMYDGSSLPLDENIADTRRVVEAARTAGVSVEAELGHVGSGRDYQEFGAQRKGFTRPDDAARFVAETGVDFLAVAIGTAHGVYDGDPELDVDLLRELAARVAIPLVLHGGTGCSDDQFRAVIAEGIAKINVSTDLLLRTAASLREMARTGEPAYFDFEKAAIESYRSLCTRYLQLFGASGKAS